MWTAKPSAFKSEVPEQFMFTGLTILELEALVAFKLEPIVLSPLAIASMMTEGE